MTDITYIIKFGVVGAWIKLKHRFIYRKVFFKYLLPMFIGTDLDTLRFYCSLC